ncbi:MAG: hypothetical protein KDB03_08225 [Planctomycetales bacterium]|nr:hypothetical protein [Planctomycetales bacterium]
MKYQTSQSDEDQHDELVVGIGSPHGDDAVGWNVIDCLAEFLSSSQMELTTRQQNQFSSELLSQSKKRFSLQTRKAAVPHEILDWLSPTNRIHVVDAVLNPPGVNCFQVSILNSELQLIEYFPTSQLGNRTGDPISTSKLILHNCASTHSLDILTVLRLANELGQFPAELLLWTIGIQSTCLTPQEASISTETTELARTCAALIASFLIRSHDPCTNAR